MQILHLIYEDGETHKANFAMLTTDALIRALRFGKIETIVVGEINQDGDVIWEKQFSEVTVMPSSFGKPS